MSDLKSPLHFADSDYPRVGGIVDSLRIVEWPSDAVGGQGRVAFALSASGRNVALKFEDPEGDYFPRMDSFEERFFERWQDWRCGLGKKAAQVILDRLCKPLVFGPGSDLWNDVEIRRRAFSSEIEILSENSNSSNVIDGLPIYFGSGRYCWRDRKGRAHDRRYFVMERLKNLGRLPSDEQRVASLVVEICRILKELHRRSIFHQDIKEANLMRRVKTNELVLIDFGISSVREGGRRGTPGYAAPELFNGERATPSTDIFSLGVLISQCFRGEIPSSWQKITNTCIRVSAKDRYRQIEDLMRAIQNRNVKSFA